MPWYAFRVCSIVFLHVISSAFGHCRHVRSFKNIIIKLCQAKLGTHIDISRFNIFLDIPQQNGIAGEDLPNSEVAHGEEHQHRHRRDKRADPQPHAEKELEGDRRAKNLRDIAA